MLEIILLITLARRIGETVARKGRKGGWYKLLLVLLWFGGEIGGGVVGYLIADAAGTSEIIAYPIALAGAAAGAGIAFLIAHNAAPTEVVPPPPPPRFS